MLLYAIDAADNQRRFYHFDEAGNTVFLTGDNGTVTDSYGLTPYGEVASRSGSTDNPFVFQGQYGVLQVEDTSLYFMRARWYDAASARFLSRDPVQSLDPRSINPYPYAWGDPLRYIDPVGLGSKLRDGGLPRGSFGGGQFTRSFAGTPARQTPWFFHYDRGWDKPIPRGSFGGEGFRTKFFGGTTGPVHGERKFFSDGDQRFRVRIETPLRERINRIRFPGTFPPPAATTSPGAGVSAPMAGDFRTRWFQEDKEFNTEPPPDPVATGPLPIILFQNPSGLFGAGSPPIVILPATGDPPIVVERPFYIR
jgi:RHS repeat-associated protein